MRKGVIPTKETRKKMSLAHIGKVISEKTRKKLMDVMRKKIKYKQVPSPYSDLKSNCWICTSHKKSAKYIQIWRYGKLQSISHYVYKKHYKKKIPKGMIVCHKCDRPKCINPEHLFLGTYKDNSQDMIKKRRGGNQYKKRLGKRSVKE